MNWVLNPDGPSPLLSSSISPHSQRTTTAAGVPIPSTTRVFGSDGAPGRIVHSRNCSVELVIWPTGGGLIPREQHQTRQWRFLPHGSGSAAVPALGFALQFRQPSALGGSSGNGSGLQYILTASDYSHELGSYACRNQTQTWREKWGP
jgi:hypothetical protein